MVESDARKAKVVISIMSATSAQMNASFNRLSQTRLLQLVTATREVLAWRLSILLDQFQGDEEEGDSHLCRVPVF